MNHTDTIGNSLMQEAHKCSVNEAKDTISRLKEAVLTGEKTAKDKCVK